MKRRIFLQTTTGALAGLWISPPAGRAGETANASDEDLLAQARTRIQDHRKGPGVVIVRHADGRPARDARVRFEQVRHAFLFGCNFFRFGRLKEPADETAYRQRFADLLNFATLGFYWPMYEGERGRPSYEYTDGVLAWCREQGMTCKGHPLVWDFADPRWLPQDFAEIRTLSHARVRDIVTRFRSRLDLWDVVNEPTHLGRFKTRLGEWAIAQGAVPYVRDHLHVAREANPQATLLVNDYRTDTPFYQILDALRDQGKLLFDAVGIQSHMHGGGWPLRQVWDVCDRYARLNLPIHFTETTIVSGPRLGPGENWGATTADGEARQADYVPRFYTMLFAHPAVQALTWWDFSDQGAWQGAAAGLVRKDMSPKPVYDRLKSLVKGDWWTRAEGRTNEQGEWAVSAFYGTHRVTAESADNRKSTREVVWQRGEPNRVELTIA